MVAHSVGGLIVEAVHNLPTVSHCLTVLEKVLQGPSWFWHNRFGSMEIRLTIRFRYCPDSCIS